MVFLPSLSRKTITGVEKKALGVRSSIISHHGRSQYAHTWNVEKAVRDAYEKVIWIYRGVDAIADNASRLPIKVLDGDPEHGREVNNTPILRLLNRRANSYETARIFRYRLSTQLVLSKKGVFVEVKETRGGEPYSLELLPPHMTDPVPGKDKFLDGFKVNYPGGGRETIPQYQRGNGRGVIWIRHPHPLDPYSGSTPLEAAGLSIDTDFYARLFNRNFLMNDGRPGGLIAVQGEISDDDAEELKRRFSGGPGTAGRTSVIEADNLSWVDTATSPRDAQYTQSLNFTKDSCLIALGTPESVMGNASGRTFANADAEKELFWTVTMMTHIELVASGFDELTTMGQDDDEFVVHDVSGIGVLQREKRERDAKALEEFGAGLITVDEYREITGREPFERPGSRALWIGGGTAIARDDEDDKALKGSVAEQAQAEEGATPAADGGAGITHMGGDPDVDETATVASLNGHRRRRRQGRSDVALEEKGALRTHTLPLEMKAGSWGVYGVDWVWEGEPWPDAPPEGGGKERPRRPPTAKKGAKKSSKGTARRGKMYKATDQDRKDFNKRHVGNAIPPAWTDVEIVEDDDPDKVDLLALGTDSKGRRIPLYTKEFRESQDGAKFLRVKALEKHIETLDAYLDDDAVNLDSPESDTAAALLVIRVTGMRIGSTKKTGGDVQAFGASTLQGKHVTLSGEDRVAFDFIGKHGVHVKVGVNDETLYEAIRLRQQDLGRKRNTPLFNTSDGKVRKYFQDTVGSEFQVKDLRTRQANKIALETIKKMKKTPKSKRDLAQMRNAVGDKVAASLGNNRNQALKSYINPIVFEPWERALEKKLNG